MQLAAANRYVYQHSRTARDKYVLVFREYEPRSIFLPGAALRRCAKLRRCNGPLSSAVRSDGGGEKKGAKRERAAFEL